MGDGIRTVTPFIRAIIICTAALAASLPAWGLPKHYAYVDLGVSHNYLAVGATAINDSGQVVGWHINGLEKAFVWQDGAGLTDLGAPDLGFSKAYGINDAGVIVGQACSSPSSGYPFIRRGASGMVNIGTLGGNWGLARDINNAGQVVGRSVNAGGYGRAFIWQEGSPMRAMGTMGGLINEALAINDHGRAVGVEYPGGGDLGGSYTRAFIWDSDVGMRQLQGTGIRDNACGINNLGQAVGSVEVASRIPRAALWLSETHRVDLGTLTGLPGSTSTARGINNLGQVVGRSSDSQMSMSAFIWESATGMVDLNTLVTGIPANVRLTDAAAINNNGWIVGTASITGKGTCLYMLVPTCPEPGSLIALGAGLVSLTASARRKR